MSPIETEEEIYQPRPITYRNQLKFIHSNRRGHRDRSVVGGVAFGKVESADTRTGTSGNHPHKHGYRNTKDNQSAKRDQG